MQVYIYVLELVQGKYYVGRTSQPVLRIIDHFLNGGAFWTKRYPPKKVMETVVGDVFDEDKTVIRMMSQYGINNVRGGSFPNYRFQEGERQILLKMIRGASDACFFCGSKGHFIKDCPVKEEEESDEISIANLSISKEQSTPLLRSKEQSTPLLRSKEQSTPLLRSKEVTCYRCGRIGHYATTCYAKSHIKGHELN